MGIPGQAMFVLYCDETNFQKTSKDFFVYGGLAIDGANLAALSKAIQNIRIKHGVPKDYTLKFNPGPKEFTHAQFIDLKKAVIEAAVEHKCLLLINLLLHDIAKSSEEARRMGINTLAYHFDCLLHRPKVPGLMLIDRFDDKQIDGQLREKLMVGLTGQLPYGGDVPLKHIVGFHLSGIGQSHFCSLIDVILGSLRFAINSFTQNVQAHESSAAEILNQLAPLFFREGGVFQDPTKVHSISLWFSPKTVKVNKFKDQYVALKNFLAVHGIDAAQTV
jgi:hypothetical protein